MSNHWTNSAKLCIQARQAIWEQHLAIASDGCHDNLRKLPENGKNDPFIKIPISILDFFRDSFSCSVSTPKVGLEKC